MTKFLSYRNQFIDLLCKSMHWFLYDRGLRHERVDNCCFENESLKWISVNFLIAIFYYFNILDVITDLYIVNQCHNIKEKYFNTR